MNCYCKYCGYKAPSIHSLTGSLCLRHPSGPNKGKHALYEGSEKDEYACKFCGKTYPLILSLTSSLCSKHPDGSNKGKHEPAI